MKVKKYVVLWHEDNDSGVPKHVMGVSPVFDAEIQARKWIRDQIAEDSFRNPGLDDALEDDVAFAKSALSEVVWTHGNNQHTYYKIEKIELDDRAAACVEEVEDILKDFKFHPKKKEDELQVIKRALIYIGEHKKEWLPLREWAVDIRFCPAACVHHVMARTGEEAQQMVDDMLDNHTLELTEEQKAEMMDCLLENVETTELVGPEDD